MMVSSIIIAITFFILVFFYRKKRPGSKLSPDDTQEREPDAVLNIDLEDCIISENPLYFEMPDTRGDAFSNKPPQRINKVCYVLKYETEYKGKAVTFRSELIGLERTRLIMKMLQKKQTTIEIFEDQEGNIEYYRYDLRFLNDR